MMKFTLIYLLLFLVMIKLSHQNFLLKRPKNIVIIMADDFGYDDVGYHGSNEIPTPNIDALAYNSVILNRFYTPPLCTPSRSSLMTGKYPHRIGMQHFVIPSDEPWALPIEEKILPQYLKEVGYKTALIGKWHLGFYNKKFTPNERGFDTFFGYLGPYIDYYDYTLKMFDRNYSRGYDLRSNDKVVKNQTSGEYATNLFTKEAVKVIEQHNSVKPLFLMLNHLAPHAGNEDNPMQAPAVEIDKFPHIKNKKRQTLAGMISSLDQSVGEIVKTLVQKKMLQDTVILFYSDNGGPTIGLHSTNASNYPLRGQKHSGWEGAIRANAFIYVPNVFPGVRNQFMHVSDILPTLANFAGFKIDSRKIDGVDQGNMINFGLSAPRNEIVNIDDVFGFGSLIYKNYKFLNGTLANGAFDGWLAQRNLNTTDDDFSYGLKVLNSVTQRSLDPNLKQNLQSTVNRIFYMREKAQIKCSKEKIKNACDLTKSPCLFNILDDPCEENNLANIKINEFQMMKQKYHEKLMQVQPSRRVPSDPSCDPISFNSTWTWWKGEL